MTAERLIQAICRCLIVDEHGHQRAADREERWYPLQPKRSIQSGVPVPARALM